MSDIMKRAAEVTGASSWEQIYHILEPSQLPWNAGGPDPDLMRLVREKRITPGKAVDLGTGPGHDAIFLAREGFAVTAVDISKTALKLALANANLSGLGTSIEFRQADVLTLDLPPGSLSLAYDRGLFHFLPAGRREDYISLIKKALAPQGQLLLRTFSDKEPLRAGASRFSRMDLETLFLKDFEFLEISEGTFAGPQKPQSILSFLRKR